MIMVVVMTQILGEYTKVLARVTERLFSRRGVSFGTLWNFRFASTTSSSDSASFLGFF
ncbi:hypothetical protein Lalb_Chr10g0103111 [Lupinus albus]|uniref:Uncharacterized protein n=1 Tax=Lupinus albus TaxID=3870 RepID=A0A6A4PXH1_LUPAL|nr:hypothetical protein Lalb_Chr10g0103111 [Lupinus albus]